VVLAAGCALGKAPAAPQAALLISASPAELHQKARMLHSTATFHFNPALIPHAPHHLPLPLSLTCS
jgi:hypothetical protein